MEDRWQLPCRSTTGPQEKPFDLSSQILWTAYCSTPTGPSTSRAWLCTSFSRWAGKRYPSTTTSQVTAPRRDDIHLTLQFLRPRLDRLLPPRRYYAIGLGGNTDYTAYSSIYEVCFSMALRVPAAHWARLIANYHCPVAKNEFYRVSASLLCPPHSERQGRY